MNAPVRYFKPKWWKAKDRNGYTVDIFRQYGTWVVYHPDTTNRHAGFPNLESAIRFAKIYYGIGGKR